MYKKVSTDSWVDEVRIDNNKFIGRKNMDYINKNYN